MGYELAEDENTGIQGSGVQRGGYNHLNRTHPSAALASPVRLGERATFKRPLTAQVFSSGRRFFNPKEGWVQRVPDGKHVVVCELCFYVEVLEEGYQHADGQRRYHLKNMHAKELQNGRASI